jgi:predicted oxidoreductase
MNTGLIKCDVGNAIQITPTNRQKLEAQKTCDIISPGSQGIAGDICYKKQHINRQNP